MTWSLCVCVQVEGGSGAVSWSVSDSDVAVVTIKGEVMAGKRRGQVDIQASDARNPLHTATGQVSVSTHTQSQINFLYLRQIHLSRSEDWTGLSNRWE